LGVAVVLSLLAAVLYGISDFTGGLASRRATAVTVLLYSYPFGGALMSLLLVFFPGSLDWSTALFGAAGGLAGMVGVMAMYTAMTHAPMNVISPITAVLAAVVPVAFGVITGERPAPATWIGIALGLAAVVLVSRTPEDHPHGAISRPVIGLALLSGIGFGVYFICLAQPGHGSGIWPVVISRLTSAALIVPIAMLRREARPADGRMRGSLFGLAVVTGAFDAGANLFFLLATRHGYLSIASVITSLYPATTVILAGAVLREHTGRIQRVGLLLAAGAIVLITV
jgi:drug/metabolite transporter (DMT)-like permease